jgi:hypothetical protein
MAQGVTCVKGLHDVGRSERIQPNRAYYIRGACEGLFSIRQIAERLPLCTRRVKYLKAAQRNIGGGAFVHGNKGCAPVNKIPDHIRKQIVALKMTEPYTGVNFARFTEIL